eukprot:jgi/Mesen1/1163/ME000124S00195
MDYLTRTGMDFGGGKQSAAMFEVGADMLIMLVPIWFSIAVGLILGWSWKPRWVSLLVVALRSRPRLAWSFPPGFGARRIWLAATAAAAVPAVHLAWSQLLTWVKERKDNQQQEGAEKVRTGLVQLEPQPSSEDASGGAERLTINEETRPELAISRRPRVELHAVHIEALNRDDEEEEVNEEEVVVSDDDLEQLCMRLDCEDGGPEWALLMEKKTRGMTYTAWRRDPEVGPTEYRSRTVVQECTPELMRDFFWDDDFRKEWDDLLLSHKTLEACTKTGVQIVQWVRKFPFFCKDREYVIGRRIWSLGSTFYCITKGVHHPEAPPKETPRRVDVFYSSWRIRAVEDGACEVMLFHHEDMGLQRDVAKFGIRQGMWGCVQKIEPGVRRYRSMRSARKPMSRSASMANINTPISAEVLTPSARAPSRFYRSFSDFRGLVPESPAAAAGAGSVERSEPSTPLLQPSPTDRAAGVLQNESVTDVLEEEEEDVASVEESEVDSDASMGALKAKFGRRHKSVGWVVAGSAVAVVLGIDKGIIAKVVVAGIVRKVIGHINKKRAV